jgi:hypothetical protein
MRLCPPTTNRSHVLPSPRASPFALNVPVNHQAIGTGVVATPNWGVVRYGKCYGSGVSSSNMVRMAPLCFLVFAEHHQVVVRPAESNCRCSLIWFRPQPFELAQPAGDSTYRQRIFPSRGKRSYPVVPRAISAELANWRNAL